MTMSRQQSQLQAEMEIKLLFKLTSEERRKELRKETFRDLKEMELARRRREAEEGLYTQRKERTEQESKAQQREEKVFEKETGQTMQKERLQWEQVMMVEKPITSSTSTPDELKKKQQRRRKEAERYCCRQSSNNEARVKTLISEHKSQVHVKRGALMNNWVGKQQTGCHSVPEEPIQHLSAERSLKSQGKHLIYRRCILLF